MVGDRWLDVAAGPRGRRARHPGANRRRRRARKQRPPDGARGRRGRGQSRRGRELDSPSWIESETDSKSEMLIARSVHPLPGEAERKERLLALVDGFSSRRVLVVGDLIADEFIYGEVSRVSREAPVLILKYDATADRRRRRRQRREQRRGARRPRRGSPAWSAPMPRAGGCWRASIAASIGRTSCAPASTARRSRRESSPAACTPRKQQVVRIDRDAGWPLDEAVSARAREEDRAGARRLRRRAAVRLRLRARDAGAGRRRFAARVARRTRRRPIPVLLDSRYRLLDYRGLDHLHAERVGSRAGARHPHRR